MDWLSLIPAGLSLLGGIFGGNNTSTTSTKLSPELQALATKVLGKAGTIMSKPYQAYTGQRVAGPTASRTALDPLMAQIGQKTQTAMNDGMGYQQRISQLLNGGPGRVTAPTMVPGGPVATYERQGAVTPVPGA